MSSTANEPRATETPAAGKQAKWWCNFCDFKTDDQKEYLSHSCAEVLKQKGKTVTPTGKNACGE
jgi:hypothetical protein